VSAIRPTEEDRGVSDTSQGPGWWQASDGKWYPPEQAPGYQPPAAGAAAPAPSGGDTGAAGIGDAFTFGWNKFIANAGPIIIALLIGFLVLVVLTIIWFVAVAGIGTSTVHCSTDTNGFTSCHSSGGGFFLSLLAYAIFMAFFWIGMFLIRMAVIRAGLILTKGEELTGGSLLSTDQLGPYVIASIIVGLGTGFLALFCVIPGLIFAFFAEWFGWFLLDKKMSPIDSIKASFTFVSQNLGVLILFFLASLVVTFVGELLCFVGLLVAVPVVILAQGYLYRKLNGEPVVV
jgi:uncharacterized membrane protein